MPRRDDECPQLLSLAVHEFRTPASVVGGYLRMLQRDADHPLSPRQLKMVEEAERSCARIVALVAELSDIAKLDTGTMSLARQTIELFPTIHEVASDMHEAEDREVRLEVRGDLAGASVTGDVTRLRNAFAAIFRAILREQAAARTVAVDCRLAEKGGRRSAVVVVADESRVHEAYDSEAAAFDEKRGGLGLALPIARRIIEAHGGQLSSPAVDGNRGIAVFVLPVTEYSS